MHQEFTKNCYTSYSNLHHEGNNYYMPEAGKEEVRIS